MSVKVSCRGLCSVSNRQHTPVCITSSVRCVTTATSSRPRCWSLASTSQTS